MTECRHPRLMAWSYTTARCVDCAKFLVAGTGRCGTCGLPADDHPQYVKDCKAGWVQT